MRKRKPVLAFVILMFCAIFLLSGCLSILELANDMLGEAYGQTKESEGKNTLAAMLQLKVLERYKSRFFITDFIPEAEKSYSKLRIFKPIETDFGCTFYRNLAFSQAVERRFPKLKSIVPLYSFLEKCANSALFLSRKLTSRKTKSDFKIVESKVFDAEFDDFIGKYCNENNLVVRSSVFFDWIVKYPWVLQQQPDGESKRYHFSSVSERFEYHSVKIYDGQKLIGFMFLKIRDKRLAVSFSYLNNACAKDAVNYILQISSSKNLDTIVTFDKKLINELTKKRMKYVFAKKTAKKYFFPRNFDITSSAFQEGDGDMVFT